MSARKCCEEPLEQGKGLLDRWAMHDLAVRLIRQHAYDLVDSLYLLIYSGRCLKHLPVLSWGMHCEYSGYVDAYRDICILLQLAEKAKKQGFFLVRSWGRRLHHTIGTLKPLPLSPRPTELRLFTQTCMFFSTSSHHLNPKANHRSPYTSRRLHSKFPIRPFCDASALIRTSWDVEI